MNMRLKKWMLMLVLCAGIIITYTGCGSEPPVSENQFCLDTICTVTVYNEKQEDAQKALEAAFACCRKYEDMLSKTVKGSDIYKINHAQGKAVTVCDETLQLIKKGIRYGRLSEGKFDITIGAVSDLWDFKETKRVPYKEKLRKATETVDYRKIKITGNKVQMEDPRARLDLGGIGKGYIADRVIETLEKQGVEQAVISLGGNVAVLGEKEKDTPWTIGIERPYSKKTEVIGAVHMTDETIVTSGVYERFFIENGKTYHHVLDAQTGYPVKTTLEAAVVKGKKGTSADCDALSTICLMLGKEKSRELLKNQKEIQAAFIDRNDRITAVNGMEILPAE